MIGLDIIYPIASKDSANCSIFYISINKIITKWLINNICYYLHINKNKNIHLRIYK